MKDRVNKKHTKNFTITSNKILQDSRLSYEAIGVFMYLWSMPDDWQVVVKQVMRHNNSSEYSVRKALRELRDFGYMRWVRTQGYFIYDMCEEGSFHCSDIQHNEIHCSDIQHNDIYIQKNNLNKQSNKEKEASASLSQSSYSEIPNNSVGAKNARTRKQLFSGEFQEWYECFTEPKNTIDWNKPSLSKEKLQKKFVNAVDDVGFDDLMQNTKSYLLFKKFDTSGTGKMMAETFLNGKYAEDYKAKYEAVCKKQGKPLPIQQKAPEKQQEEVKMKEDAQKKRQSVLKRLNGDEVEFMNHIKKTLKTYFENPLHHYWIDDFLLNCKENVAYFEFTEQKHIDIVNRNFQKFEQIIMREIASRAFAKEGENLKIELKLID